MLTTLVRLIMTGYIVAGKNNGEYKHGGIAEKPPTTSQHCPPDQGLLKPLINLSTRLI